MTIESKHGLDEPRPESTATPSHTKRQVLIVLVVLALGSLYLTGRLDHLLYNVGLNYKECARNGLGATFCGSELTEYREHTETAVREGKEAGAKIEREGKEAEAKAQSELKENEQHIEETSAGSATPEEGAG